MVGYIVSEWTENTKCGYTLIGTQTHQTLAKILMCTPLIVTLVVRGVYVTGAGICCWMF